MKNLAETVSDRAAEWIPPRTGGLRIITLWDMKEYLAKRLTNIAWNLALCQATAFTILKDEEWPETLKNVKRYANEIWEECRFLGLPCTEKQAVRFGSHLKVGDRKAVESASDELMQRFQDETDALKLFYVPNDKIGFYNRTDLFGEDFKTNFPTANSEIIEAGNCFAFDRFTACAYHLCRALEISLRVVFVSLGMQPRIWGVTRWKNLCDRIARKIEKNDQHRANDPVWKQDRDFFEKAHAFLSAARAPLRNSTVHVDVTYPDESSVRPVWLATEGFMRHIATKLKE